MNKDIFPWLSKIFVWKKKNFPGKGKSFDYLSNNQNNKVPIFLAKVTLFLLFFSIEKKVNDNQSLCKYTGQPIRRTY